MTPVQRKMARHALGLTNSKAGKSYRNRYLAPGTGPIPEVWADLCAQGFAEAGATSSGMKWFHLTEAGARVVLKRGETLDPEDFPALVAPVEGERT